jgi:hypothetical protein
MVSLLIGDLFTHVKNWDSRQMIAMKTYITSHLFQQNSPGQVQQSLRYLQLLKKGQDNSPVTLWCNQGGLVEISSWFMLPPPLSIVRRRIDTAYIPKLVVEKSKDLQE